MARWEAREQAKSDRQLARSRARHEALRELPPDQLPLLDRWEAWEQRRARLDMVRDKWRPRWDEADYRNAPPPAVTGPDGVSVRVMVHGPRVSTLPSVPDGAFGFGAPLGLAVLAITSLYLAGVWAVREVLHIRPYSVRMRIDGKRSVILERGFRTMTGAERFAAALITRIEREGVTGLENPVPPRGRVLRDLWG